MTWRAPVHYGPLGRTRESNDAELKKGYHKMSLKMHPDKCKATGAEECFKSISKAWACLSDPDKRAAGAYTRPLLSSIFSST